MADRAADCEALKALQVSLDANTEAVKELVGWKPGVDSRVDALRGSVEDLRVKVDQIAQRQEEKVNSAYKVFQDEEFDCTKPAVTHGTAPPTGVASGPNGHGDDLIHWELAKGWLPPLCRPRSEMVLGMTLEQ